MKFTEERESGLPLIDGYGDGGFRVAGTRHDGSILIFGQRVAPWPVETPPDISLITLEPLFETLVAPEILLLGTGQAALQMNAGFHAALERRGVGLEVMATGAAARTYNLLRLERRNVAAALIAVP